MSTKAAIAYGDDFHFYHEAWDDDHVYLELNERQFEASHERVMVLIPIPIWETIRHLGGASFDLIDRSDEDLMARVEADVDERIAAREKFLRENPDDDGWGWLSAANACGDIDAPREEQIANGMDYYRSERERQREIHAAVVNLRSTQGKYARVLLGLDERQVAIDLLIMLIEHLSEDYCAAGWSREIEMGLWESAIGLNDKYRKHGQHARYLSEKCRGWVMWDDATGEPKYVSLSKWNNIYPGRMIRRGGEDKDL